MTKITLKKIRSIWDLVSKTLETKDIWVSVCSESEDNRSSDWSRNRRWQSIADGVLTPEETFAAIVCCEENLEDLILWFETEDEGTYWRTWLTEFVSYV